MLVIAIAAVEVFVKVTGVVVAVPTVLLPNAMLVGFSVMGCVTVSVADPETAPCVALMVVVPAATPEANPLELIVAIVCTDEVHVAVLVRFCVLPSLYFPVAVNCCVAPFAIDGDAGVTAIDCSVGAAAGLTVRLASVPTLHVAFEELVVKFPTKMSCPPGVARSPATRWRVIWVPLTKVLA